MRFIVDLYRYLLIGFCGVVVVGAFLLAFAAVDPGGPLGSFLRGSALAIAAGALLFLVLNLGVVATLLSLHDRHAEIAANASDAVAELRALTAAIERMAGGVA